MKKDGMGKTTLKWNLGFASDEVVPRLEALFLQHGYAYTHDERVSDADNASERHYRTPLGQGDVEVCLRPLRAQSSSFGSIHQQRRTLLRVTYSGVGEADRARFKQQLTLAFLRVGG